MRYTIVHGTGRAIQQVSNPSSCPLSSKPTTVRPEDVRRVNEAIDAAKADRPDLDPELLDFLCRILMLQIQGTFQTELALMARFPVCLLVGKEDPR